MNTIKYNYQRLSQSAFETKLDFIIFSCTNNQYFTALPTAMTILDGKRNDWITALNKSKAGNHLATEQAGETRKEIDVILKDNGIYINKTANGNVGKLISSGYDLTKEREYTKNPEVMVEQGEASGSGKILIETVKDAYAYLVFWSSDPVPEKIEEKNCTRLPMSTKHYLPFSGAVSGKQNWMIYYTVGVNGETEMRGPFLFKLL